MSRLSRFLWLGLVAFTLTGCGGGTIAPEQIQKLPELGMGKPPTLSEYEMILGSSREATGFSPALQSQIDGMRGNSKVRTVCWGSESKTLVVVAVEGEEVVGRTVQYGDNKGPAEPDRPKAGTKPNANPNAAEPKGKPEVSDGEAEFMANTNLMTVCLRLNRGVFPEGKSLETKEVYLSKLNPTFDQDVIDAVKKNEVVVMWGKPDNSALIAYSTKVLPQGVLVANMHGVAEVWSAQKLNDTLKAMGMTRTNKN